MVTPSRWNDQVEEDDGIEDEVAGGKDDEIGDGVAEDEGEDRIGGRSEGGEASGDAGSDEDGGVREGKDTVGKARVGHGLVEDDGPVEAIAPEKHSSPLGLSPARGNWPAGDAVAEVEGDELEGKVSEPVGAEVR